MKYRVLLLVAGFVLVVGLVCVFAQDRPPEGGERPFQPRPGNRDGVERPDRPERANRQMRPFQPNMGGGPVAMELSGSTLFLVSGTKVFKINSADMKLEAQRDLADAPSSDDSAADAVMKKFDRDGDGKVSQEEWPGPAQMFKELDSDGDGFIGKEELPQDLLQRARRQARRAPAGGPAAIKVAATSLYVYLGGTLYKLKVSDLALEGSLDIEQQGVPAPGAERKRARQREGADGEQPPERPNRPKKEKDADKDDFGF